MANYHLAALLLGALLLAEAALAARQPQDEQQIQLERRKKRKHPYSSPYGLFIQVRTFELRVIACEHEHKLCQLVPKWLWQCTFPHNGQSFSKCSAHCITTKPLLSSTVQWQHYSNGHFLIKHCAPIILQERASKQLPGPGQHFSFGAVKPWEDILAMLDEQEGEPMWQAHAAQKLLGSCLILLLVTSLVCMPAYQATAVRTHSAAQDTTVPHTWCRLTCS